MSYTPLLAIEEIPSGSNSPETYANEGMRALEQGAQYFANIADKDLSAPPGGPAEGDAYIVAAGASGAWTGWSGRIAYYKNGAWASITLGTKSRAVAFVTDEATEYQWSGTAWAIRLWPASVTWTSTDAGATAGPVHILYRNSASPAASDLLGQLQFDGKSSTGVTRTYGNIVARIDDATNASEDATLLLQTMLAGTLTTIISAGGTAIAITPATTVTGTLTTGGNIELGHASDTTLSRVSAGVVAVEGVTVDTISAANTLTNKTLTAPAINGTVTTSGLTLPAHTLGGTVTANSQSVSGVLNFTNGITLASGSTLSSYVEATATPTVTALSGTFTTVSCIQKSVRTGNGAAVFYGVTITTNGTAAVAVSMPTGFTCNATYPGGGSFRECAAAGFSGGLQISASGTAAVITKYDGTYPGGTGYLLQGALAIPL